MTMKKLSYILFLVLLPLFVGCASTPQMNVATNDTFWQAKDKKIGVSVLPIPEPKGHIAGAGCLLCIATASTINSGLDKHMKLQSNEDLQDIQSLLVSGFREKGFDVLDIKEPIDFKSLKKKSSKEPNTAKKDFSKLGGELGVDKFLVVDLSMLGTLRQFSSYVPVGPPSTIIKGKVYIVDANTNIFDYYTTIDISKLAQGQWKEPPNYPAITNAYYTALDIAKSKILAVLKENAMPGFQKKNENSNDTEEKNALIQ